MTDSGQTQGFDNPALNVSKSDLYGPENGDANQSNGVNGHASNGNLNGQVNGNGAVGVSSLEVSDKDQSDDLEQSQQAKRDREPLLFCKWITDRPRTWFGIFLGFHIFFIVVTMILTAVGYDIIPIVFDQLPLDIRDNKDFLRGMAYDQRNDKSNDLVSWMSGDTDYQSERSEQMDSIELLYYYPKKDKTVFTKATLMAINETETKFINEGDYLTKFCKLEKGICEKPSSILRFFDGTYSNVDSDFYDPGFNNVINVLNKANYYNETKLDLAYHLGKDAEITSTKAFSYATRSSLPIGWPLKGYNSTTDRESKQEDEVKTFYQKNIIPNVGDPAFKQGVGGMDFVYNSGVIIGLSILNQVIRDFMLIVLSFFFIVIFMCIQTQSLFVSLFSIMSIFTGFCGANLIYRVVLQFRYFGIFHILSVFIILGIGADDVFVFFDTWKETAHHSYKSLSHRVSDCFRKAALAMLFTSITTAIAFFVSATSPFLGVYSFGVFSGVLVLVNYCTVITFLPCMVIVYHLYFDKFRCCCCCPKPISITDPSTPSKSGTSRKNAIVRFFAGPFFRFVSHKIARWFILLFHAVILAVMIYYCTQLQVNEEQIKFMKDGTLTGRYLNMRSELFPTRRQENLKVYLVWGLKEQDISKCHHTNASCTGVSVWDDSFSLNSPQAQLAFYNLCEDIKNLDDNMISKLNIARSSIDNKPIVSCFMSEMKQFLENTTYGYFPVNSSLSSTIMSSHSSIYQYPLTTDQNQQTAFGTGLSFFMYNGFDYSDIMKYMKDYRSLVGEEETNFTKKVDVGAGPVGFKYLYGTKLKYAAVTIDTSIDGRNLGYPKGLPLRDEWENWTKEKMKNLPDSLKNGYQATPEGTQGFNLWHWLAVQKVLVSSAVTGIAVGVAVALPILIVATMNIVVGVMATLIIGIITTCVIGVIPAAGWKLGFLESLNLVLVVGLAVDYVVHLAEAYARAPYHDRLSRCKCMLEELGISVLSGAITTLGSSVFLLFAQIIFFSQFGIFILSTIGFSILNALSLFSTLMALMGPQGNTGSIRCCK